MKKEGHLICGVIPDSIAWELGISDGDRLLSINGEEIKDIFDYQYLIEEEYIEVDILNSDGTEICTYEIEKDPDEDLGLIFESGIIDDYRSCTNKCIFCFIDQMPPGMRDTLYFKDDDSRLSFLQGNYITMTNMKEEDFDRIIRFNLAPINISVQTTNPELRVKMLNNRFAGKVLKYIDKLYEASVPMNGQIVLCKGYNDKGELKRTIEDLLKFAPVMRSVSVVPSGVTKFREGLCPLEPFDKEDAIETIDMIEKYQKIAMDKFGIHFIHASDEWYILAKREFPKEESYDDYIQLENGVGMMRLLIDEFTEHLDKIKGDDRKRRVSVATGKLAYPTLVQITGKIKDKFPNVEVYVYLIKNYYFGETITVSGLITGGDLVSQLKGKELGDELLIPGNMLKADENIFLDDLTLDIVESDLQTNINVVKSSGVCLLESILGNNIITDNKGTENKYEL